MVTGASGGGEGVFRPGGGQGVTWRVLGVFQGEMILSTDNPASTETVLTLSDLMDRLDDYLTVEEVESDPDQSSIWKAAIDLLSKKIDNVMEENGGNIIKGSETWHIEFLDEPGSGMGGPIHERVHYANYKFNILGYEHGSERERWCYRGMEDDLFKEYGYPLARDILVSIDPSIPPSLSKDLVEAADKQIEAGFKHRLVVDPNSEAGPADLTKALETIADLMAKCAKRNPKKHFAHAFEEAAQLVARTANALDIGDIFKTVPLARKFDYAMKAHTRAAEKLGQMGMLSELISDERKEELKREVKNKLWQEGLIP